MPSHDDLPDLLRKIERAKPTQVPSEPNQGYIDEKRDLERKKAEVQLEGELQDINERRKYAHRIFCLIVAWLLVVALILFLQGFKFAVYRHSFQLSNSVLLTLIGSTTASVLAIFAIVTKYLFPNH